MNTQRSIAAIVALAVMASGCGPRHPFQAAQTQRATVEAQRIHAAVLLSMNDRPECPTIDGLFEAHILTPAQPRSDPWGHDYQIQCGPGASDVVVWSPGPDGTPHTADDVRCDH